MCNSSTSATPFSKHVNYICNILMVVNSVNNNSQSATEKLFKMQQKIVKNTGV